MSICVITENRTATHRQAVVLCCDAKYLPFAALTIHTLLRNNPDAGFDICITSLDLLDLPDVLKQANVRFCQISVGDAFDGLPLSDRFSVAAYLRLALPTALIGDYDRIAYIDCDIIVAGDAVETIFDLDLGATPVGAIMDNMKWKYPDRPTPDQKVLKLNGPYFNSGVLLIDCRAFIDQKVLEATIRIAGEHKPEEIYFDQTLLNLALTENWTALHPAWNWQWSIVRPMFEMYVDVQFVHFVGTAKPWTDNNGNLPARYRETAARFLAKYFPDVSVAKPDRVITKKRFVSDLLRHIGKVPVFHRLLVRYGTDISRVIPPTRA